MFYVDVFFTWYQRVYWKWFFFLLEHTTSSSSSSSSSKRPRLDQIPAANLDADDPLTDVHTLSYRCLGMQVDFDGSLKNVSVYVLGWRWLWFRLWQWRWYCRSASWTGEDQKGASWGTREEGKPHWSFTTFVTLIDYRKIKPFRMILVTISGFFFLFMTCLTTFIPCLGLIFYWRKSSLCFLFWCMCN